MKRYRNYFLSITLVCLLFLTLGYAQTSKAEQIFRVQPESLKSTNLVAYGSSQGKKIFYQSKYSGDFWSLTRYFVTQKNLTFCSIASAMMVLNALNIKAPLDKTYAPYRVFTQDNIFIPKVRQAINVENLYKEGLTLDDFGQLMQLFPVTVKVFHASDLSLLNFRKEAMHALHRTNTFIVVNIDRSLYGKKGGHFSPLAAYDQKTDRFLIMDVARYRYPPVWVKTNDLLKAMNTVDTTSHKTRGFAIISNTIKTLHR